MGIGTEVRSLFITKDPAMMRSPLFLALALAVGAGAPCLQVTPLRRPHALYVRLRK